MNVGVLAFHGDVSEHKDVLMQLDVHSKEIRTTRDLKNLTHLIIPGGESTVMSKFLIESGLAMEIKKRVRQGTLAVFGTCAGAILLAKQVKGSHPPKTLELMNLTIQRNAYGTQKQSFGADLKVVGMKGTVPVSFIRAPKIINVGNGIEVLASLGDDPVIVREGRMLAATCHPEVRGNPAIHKMFISL